MEEIGRTNPRWRVPYAVFTLVSLLTVGVLSPLRAAEVSIQAILGEPDKFDQQTVTVRGRASNIHRGQNARATFAVFALTDASGAKLRVFVLGHLEIPSDDEIEVTGVFQKVRRGERDIFHNELDATSIKKAAP
jgi:hypothetical protein